jgi:molybdopterin converting factor small subunit
MDDLKGRLSDEDWQTARHATWLVNGRAAHLLEGRKTRLQPDDQVWLITPAGGG